VPGAGGFIETALALDFNPVIVRIRSAQNGLAAVVVYIVVVAPVLRAHDKAAGQNTGFHGFHEKRRFQGNVAPFKRRVERLWTGIPPVQHEFTVFDVGIAIGHNPVLFGGKVGCNFPCLRLFRKGNNKQGQ